MIPFLLGSCNSLYSAVPLCKFNKEKKQIAQDFVETYFKKCENKEFSEFEGFNRSKKFQAKLSLDSLKKSCNDLYYKKGKITVEKLVSAHTANSPKDFLDVLNFKIKTEKSAQVMHLHLGIYRDQNYIEMPLYIPTDEIITKPSEKNTI